MQHHTLIYFGTCANFRFTRSWPIEESMLSHRDRYGFAESMHIWNRLPNHHVFKKNWEKKSTANFPRMITLQYPTPSSCFFLNYDTNIHAYFPRILKIIYYFPRIHGYLEQTQKSSMTIWNRISPFHSWGRWAKARMLFKLIWMNLKLFEINQKCITTLLWH